MSMLKRESSTAVVVQGIPTRFCARKMCLANKHPLLQQSPALTVKNQENMLIGQRSFIPAKGLQSQTNKGRRWVGAQSSKQS